VKISGGSSSDLTLGDPCERIRLQIVAFDPHMEYADGGTRTRTDLSIRRILSPLISLGSAFVSSFSAVLCRHFR
jgi:hypothetical protein